MSYGKEMCGIREREGTSVWAKGVACPTSQKCRGLRGVFGGGLVAETAVPEKLLHHFNVNGPQK